ncbi:hypothetical protein KBC80_03090 [Candidatus Woesebacteria bacterium]|nr:hypothetical protein [Candidatus Woesebacteria bacterium]
MKRNLFIVMMGIVTMCMYGAYPVYAHTLKIDRAIGVSVHINPDDAPIAGKESAILVEITDSSGRFNATNPSNCICTLTVKSDGKSLVQLPVVSGGSYTQLRYTFPNAGKYSVVVDGKPNGEGQFFQSFSLTYEYFVKGETSITEVNPLVPFIPYMQALCGAIIIWMFVSIKR